MKINSEQVLAPFLKWAGGKRWLVNRFPELFPSDFERYFEPFLGSGAVFFSVQPRRGQISDSNAELINTYKVIKKNPGNILRALKGYEQRHNDDYYYFAREYVPRNATARAVRTLYLNRTCWNGLYRVNKSGKFNVPRGTKDSILVETDDFQEAATALRRVSVVCCDFADAIECAQKNDFVFVDPPYTVRHNNNGFLKYNESIFTWADQIRLRDSIAAAARRGVKVLLTNADHRPIRDMYRGLGSIRTLPRASIISGSNIGRRQTTEIAVLVNYEAGDDV